LAYALPLLHLHNIKTFALKSITFREDFEGDFTILLCPLKRLDSIKDILFF